MASETSLGRVQPLFKGAYSSSITYEKLDNVLYNGSTYICKKTSLDIIPAESTEYWQLVAEKGETGNISTVVATAESSDTAYANVEITGDVGNRNLSFSFGLPAGPTGNPAAIASMTAAAFNTSADDPYVEVQFAGGTQATADFSFYFPAAANAVKKVDNVGPVGGNVALNAVRFVEKDWTGVEPSDKVALQSIARNNIDAQKAGNYVLTPSGDIQTNTFLKFDNEGNTEYATINEVPTGGQVRQVLKRINEGYAWSNISEVPSTGSAGAILTMGENNQYTWQMNAITSAEIDSLFS